jgi:uncharacterized YigZ family protein
LAYPVTSEDAVKQLLAQVKKQYHDAHHHCYAWALGLERQQYRVNDDGEPSGSAGKPIYGQILSNELTDVLVVVVRYFGGTKLGIPGLIQAYRGAARDALGKAVIITKALVDLYEIRCAYSHLNEVMQIIKEYNLDQIETDLSTECRFVVGIPVNSSETVIHKFSSSRSIRVTFIGSASK